MRAELLGFGGAEEFEIAGEQEAREGVVGAERFGGRGKIGRAWERGEGVDFREQERVVGRQRAHGVGERGAALRELVGCEFGFARGVIGHGLQSRAGIEQRELAAGRESFASGLLGDARGEDEAGVFDEQIAGELGGEERLVLAAVEPAPACGRGDEPAARADEFFQRRDIVRGESVRVHAHGAEARELRRPVLAVERHGIEAVRFQMSKQRGVVEHADLRLWHIAAGPARGVRQ